MMSFDETQVFKGSAVALTSMLLSVGSRVTVTDAGGGSSEFKGKAAVLLARLVLEASVQRSDLALMLWPDSPSQQARNNLRTLVHRVNHRFGAELLVGSEVLSLDAGHVDVAHPTAESILAALDAGGQQNCELLAHAGVDSEESEVLLEWLRAARQRMRAQQMTLLSSARVMALAASDYSRAIAWTRACLQIEPLSEHWHRQLMDVLARSGDRAAALEAYEDCKRLLRDHLGVLPDSQTRTVHLRILQGQANESAAPASVTQGLTPLKGVARFPLVEREAVLAEAQAALAHGQHLALQGEAGVGKTRLLRHLAEQGDVEQVAIHVGARDEPYSALTQVLQQVQLRRQVRIGVPEQIELARLAPMAFPEVRASEASLSPSRLHAALRHWAVQLGKAGVQRLVIDDLHYADTPSQAAIAALLRQDLDDTAEAVLPLMLAFRSGDVDPVVDDALLAAQVQKKARLLTLPRLTLEGVHALLRAMQIRRDGAQRQALAQVLLQRTGGNPMFVIELAQHAEDHPHAGFGATSTNMGALLQSRLADCGEAARQLASVAAVAVEDFSVELATAITGQAPLALMGPWNELQQRGLFGEHGLAHDLIREVALRMLPTEKRQALHGQVAEYLQAHGRQGAAVLRHWMAAENFDRALPHLIHHLDVSTAAGLPTSRIEIELLSVLERVSDCALLENKWLTAEIDGVMVDSFHPPEVWHRLAALVERIRTLDDSESTADYVAFETSRSLLDQGAGAEAYELLQGVADHLPSTGEIRARVECALAKYAYHQSGGMLEHLQKATMASLVLRGIARHSRLLAYIDCLNAIVTGPIDRIRSQATRMRAARRRGDLGVASDARLQIGFVCSRIGNARVADRHFSILKTQRGSDAGDSERVPVGESISGLCAGRFTEVLQTLTHMHRDNFEPDRLVLLANLWMYLGQWSRAEAEIGPLEREEFGHQWFSINYPVARIRAVLDQRSGKDPLPGLHKAFDAMKSEGITGTNLRLMAWEIAMQSMPAADRVPEGMELIRSIEAGGGYSRRPRAMLEVAEALSEAGSGDFREMALKAASALRKGRTGLPLYVPDGLVRCARLLQATDPAQAASLLHVARRWVHDAMDHVPDFARESFVTEIPANRLLLSEQAFNIDVTTGRADASSFAGGNAAPL